MTFLYGENNQILQKLGFKGTTTEINVNEGVCCLFFIVGMIPYFYTVAKSNPLNDKAMVLLRLV